MTEQNPVSSSKDSASVLASNNLIERVRAAIDEDERIARAALHRPPNGSYGKGSWIVKGSEIWDENDVLIVKHTWAREAAHMARHDPARVLRQVEAFRKLLGAHTPQWTHVQWWDAPETGEGNICTSCAVREPNEWELGVGNYGVKPEGWVDDYILWPCPTVLALASIYGIEQTAETRDT